MTIKGAASIRSSSINVIIAISEKVFDAVKRVTVIIVGGKNRS